MTTTWHLEIKNWKLDIRGIGPQILIKVAFRRNRLGFPEITVILGGSVGLPQDRLKLRHLTLCTSPLAEVARNFPVGTAVITFMWTREFLNAVPEKAAK